MWCCQWVESKVYKVSVKEDNNKVHILECYGIDVIARQADLPDTKSYRALCKKFNVLPGKVRRSRRIDLLIVMRENHLLPEKVRNLERLTLYQSPFRATFGGSDPKV